MCNYLSDTEKHTATDSGGKSVRTRDIVIFGILIFAAVALVGLWTDTVRVVVAKILGMPYAGEKGTSEPQETLKDQSKQWGFSG